MRKHGVNHIYVVGPEAGSRCELRSETSAGRSVYNSSFSIHQQRQWGGETKHDGQQHRVEGQVWHSFGGVHMRCVSTSTALSIYSGVGIFNRHQPGLPPQVLWFPGVELESRELTLHRAHGALHTHVDRVAPPRHFTHISITMPVVSALTNYHTPKGLSRSSNGLFLTTSGSRWPFCF